MTNLPNNERAAAHEEFTSGTFHAAALKSGVLAALALLTFFIAGNNFLNPSQPEPSIAVAIEEAPDPFRDLVLEARAAYVVDIATGDVLYAKNEEVQLPLASLTKVMTALVAAEIVPDNAVITVTKDAIAVEGDSGLREGERWRFKDLLDFTLIVSSNDGAAAVAHAANTFEKPGTTFIGTMNDRARALGMRQSYFINESGLDASTEVAGGYGSAKDMGTLFVYAVTNTPELFEATAYAEMQFASQDDLLHEASNTNAIVGEIPGLIASKTGFTDLAGGNLVVAFDAGINRPIVAVILGSSASGRFDDMRRLVRASIVNLGR